MLDRSRVNQLWKCLSAFAATPGLRRHLAAAWAMWEQADYRRGLSTSWRLATGAFSSFRLAVEAARPLVVQCHGSIGQIAVHDPIAGEETRGLLTRLLERAALGALGQIEASVMPTRHSGAPKRAVTLRCPPGLGHSCQRLPPKR